MSEYYDRQGNPIDMWEWTRQLESGNTVALTEVDGIKISTIWLGLDHSWGHGPPMIFETMIFGMNESTAEVETLEEYQWRYSSEVQALAGHDQAVAMVREALSRHR